MQTLNKLDAVRKVILSSIHQMIVFYAIWIFKYSKMKKTKLAWIHVSSWPWTWFLLKLTIWKSYTEAFCMQTKFGISNVFFFFLILSVIQKRRPIVIHRISPKTNSNKKKRFQTQVEHAVVKIDSILSCTDRLIDRKQ